jgi:hypothetical protein
MSGSCSMRSAPACVARWPPPVWGPASPMSPSSSRRVDWALLLRRTFGFDALRCPECDGRMRVLATLTDPSAVRPRAPRHARRPAPGRPGARPDLRANRPRVRRVASRDCPGETGCPSGNANARAFDASSRGLGLVRSRAPTTRWSAGPDTSGELGHLLEDASAARIVGTGRWNRDATRRPVGGAHARTGRRRTAVGAADRVLHLEVAPALAVLLSRGVVDADTALARTAHGSASELLFRAAATTPSRAAALRSATASGFTTSVAAGAAAATLTGRVARPARPNGVPVAAAASSGESHRETSQARGHRKKALHGAAVCMRRAASISALLHIGA